MWGNSTAYACNQVSDTKADGIHSTYGASHGYIARNFIFNSGDDGIAVVSYNPDHQATEITIEDNGVEHIRWGRGISIIGSTNIIIRHNRVKSVAMAAGILVAREAFFGTPGPRNVTIDGNELIDIQERLNPLNGYPRTGHGAIELNSDNDDPTLAVSDVNIIENMINETLYDGIRLLGNVCNVTLSGNHLRAVGGKAISVKSTCPKQTLYCADNLAEARYVGCRESEL